ncbi:hypothetical protein FVER14953_11660 [Fusarium verticillioides]|nr:hypothetical protein FVER14953_11660 [Fusarium verticillioides]
MFVICWSDRALERVNSAAPRKYQAVATSSIPISITINTRGDRMDQNTFAADENTALTSSRQQTVGAKGTSGVPSWNAVSANQSGCDIFELFEVYRRSANRYMNQYFECLDRLPASGTELNAYSRSQEVSTREGSEAERNAWLLKISHDSAVRDLTVLDEILDKAKEQEKPPGRTVSPGAAVW